VLSSALLLFGFSYLYGLAGTTNITDLLDALVRAPTGRIWATPSNSRPGRTAAGMAVDRTHHGRGRPWASASRPVPFHFYAPDVYQGTSAGAAAMLAVIPKVGGFCGAAARPWASSYRTGICAWKRHLG